MGETLDITGLVIEGTYSDGSKKDETITAANITGFNSTAAVASQTLTITVDGKTTTYTVEIKETPDTEKPVITLKGEATVNLENGAEYTDAGVTITDNKDTDLAATVTYTKDGEAVDSIDTSVAGTYVIHYNVSDTAGNAADEVIRTVIVAGQTPERELLEAIETANVGEEITLAKNVDFSESGLTIDKLVSLNLNNNTITGDVSITDIENSGTLDITAGIITGNLTINTPNATVNNFATVKGTITINGVAAGTWNEKTSGNTLLFKAEGKTLKIVDGAIVKALTIEATNATVAIEDTAAVTAFIANSAVEVIGADKIVNATIQASGVKLDVKPEAITTTENVIIGDKTKTPEEVTAEESFLISLEKVQSTDEGLYTINYSKADNKVEVEFLKKGLEASQNITNDVQNAAKSFIDAMFKNEELKVKEVEVLELTFTNAESDPVIELAIKLLATIGEGEDEFSKAMNGFENFLKKDMEVNESLDIKVTLEDSMEFTAEGVTAIFRIDEAMDLSL